MQIEDRGKHIVISEIEHYSVLYTARELEKDGFRVSYIKVDKDGLIDPEDVAKAINKDTFLVSIMHANNEIGVIQPIEEIGKITKEKGLIFHTDADCNGRSYSRGRSGTWRRFIKPDIAHILRPKRHCSPVCKRRN